MTTDRKAEFLAIFGSVVGASLSELRPQLDVPLRDVGLSSLKFLVLMSRIEKAVGRKMFDATSVRSIRTLNDIFLLYLENSTLDRIEAREG